MRLYRDLHVVYYIVALGGAFALLLPPVFQDRNILLPALLAFLWIILSALVFQRLAIKRLNKLMTLLEECRIKEYIEGYEKLLPRAGRKSSAALKLNLSAGYIELGHPKRALELLESLPAFPESRSGAASRLCRDNNLAVCHRMLGDLDAAERLMELFRAELADAPAKTPQRSQFAAIGDTQAVLLSMARGNFDGAAAFFEKKLPEDATLRSRVADHYALAWASTQAGEPEQAKRHLEYVLAHGGDTWYVSAARERLRRLRVK